MKTIKIIFALLLATAGVMNAQDAYHPLLKDGRTWNLIQVYERSEYVDSLGNIIDLNNDTIDIEEIWYTDTLILDTVAYALHIDGTETVDNRLCYKMFGSSKSSFGYFCEENGKVSTLIDGEWKVVLDFTLDVGDAIPYHQHVVVNSVDTIMVGEELYRRLWLGIYDDEGKCYWIEGMGSTEYGPTFPIEPVAYPFNLKWAGLVSVYDGDVCIFERNDFHQQGIGAGVVSVHANPDALKRCYDLQGRKVTNPATRGIYVKDGKKVVVK